MRCPVRAGHDECAIGLGGKTTGAGTEEGEVPVQEVKEHCAYGDAADERCRTSPASRRAGRTSKVPRHGDIRHSHQRNGDVCQNAGDRQG